MIGLVPSKTRQVIIIERLSAKEQRLHDYMVSCLSLGIDTPNIGEVCRECHTTPWTLLHKTLPSLERKVQFVDC